MRVLVDCTSRLNGGGLTFVRHLAEYAECLGHECHLLVRPESREQFGASRQLTIHTFGRPHITLVEKLIWQQFYVPNFAKKIGAQLIFNPIGMPLFAGNIPLVCQFTNAAPFSQIMTRKLVGNYNWLYFRLSGIAQRAAARVASRIVFVSEDYKRTFCERFPATASRSAVIPHGRPTPAPVLDVPVQYKPLIEKSPYLLCISHLYRYKLLETLVHAYQLGRSEFSKLNTRIIVVGAALDEEYGIELKQLIRNLGLESQVLLPGPIPAEAIPVFIRKSRGVVLQSLCENCPNSLIEGLVYGAAVVCSNIGSMMEIAGDAALTFDPRDPIDLRDKLLRILEDDSLRTEMRSRALARAQQLPSWSEVIKRFGILFEEVCAGQ
jgi:glycosyltransferase involved in cell wall biosynthesis